MEQKIKELIEKYNDIWYEKEGREGYPHDRNDVIIEIENDLKSLLALEQKKGLTIEDVVNEKPKN